MDTAHFPRISTIVRRDVLQTSPDTTVRAAADLMRDQNLTSVAYIIDDAPYIFSIEHVLGLVQHGASFERPLRDLVVPAAARIREEQTVLEAMDEMEATGSRYLAVLDCHERLCGIVTHTDIVAAIDPVFLVERKTVGEVVKRKELVTFSPDWILDDVLCHLTHVEDSIIVVDSDRLLGIITAKDAFRLIAAGRDTNLPLADYMTSPVVTVNTGAPLHDALMLIKSRAIKRVVVVDDAHRLVGVVTQSELVGFAYGYWTRLLKHHAGELRELVAMLSAKADRYRQDSVTDSLTSLGNRRMLTVRMREELERIRRYSGSPFSFILIDVDHFKHINDHHGHSAGDEVLRLIGQAIQRCVRGIDSVCRWGGDEFAVLAPHTNAESARVVANRILESARRLVYGKNLKVTVSIGFGEILHQEIEKSFFDRVDRALLRAKAAGRDRVEFALADPVL